MKKNLCLLVVFCLIISATIAFAQPQSIPNGPWLNSNQKVMRANHLQPEDLQKKLFQIEERAVEGRMKVEQIGNSAGYEWPIYVVKFGEADENKEKILIDTQIHGNEPMGTEAVLELIKILATGKNPEVLKILENVTVWFVPMLNPDGATLFETESGWFQTRQNQQVWTPGEWGLDADTPAPWYYNSRTNRGLTGYDINRDSHPHLNFDLNKHADQHPLDNPRIPPHNWGGEPGFLVTPEARALRDVFKELMPDLYVNHHHRGTNLVSEEDIRMCTLQVLAQVVPMGREFPIEDDGELYTYSLNQESLDLSKQVNYLVFDKLQRGGNSPFGAITQYPVVKDYSQGNGLPGTTLGSFSMNDAAIMLYEVRSSGQKSSGQQIKQSYIGLYETILGFATGEVYEIDPNLYDEEIPPSGPRIGSPNL